MRPVAVVLAGGTSRRFGTDKLDAEVSGVPMLVAVLDALPADWSVIVVGPVRRLDRSVRFVCEEPASGGPAAALVCGLTAALEARPDEIAVLPADAPGAPEAAVELLAELRRTGVDAVVGLAAAGREQPLQLALRPGAAAALVAAAGAGRGAGASARALLRRLTPGPVGVSLPARQTFDIDTRAQLAAWQGSASPAVTAILGRLRSVAPNTPAGEAARPLVCALDGPSGSGKSVLAAALGLRTPLALVPGDDFYSGPGQEPTPDPDALVDVMFDWARLRAEALAPLAAGRPARYRPYDWAAGDGRLAEPIRVEPAPLVVLEGVYAARPELADLLDLTVLVQTEPGVRAARLDERADDRALRELWDRAERHYFTRVRPPGAFDLVVPGG